MQEATNANISARDIEAQDLLILYKEELAISASSAKSAQLHLGIARVLEQQNDLSASLTQFQQARKLDPSLLPALRGERRLLLNDGQFKSALVAIQSEIESCKDKKLSATLYLEMAKIYEDHLKDFGKAFKCYENSISLSPHSLSTVKAMQRCAERAGFDDKLIVALEKTADLLAKSPAHHAAIQKYRGDAALARGEMDMAAELLTGALNTDAKLFHVLYSLEQIFTAKEEWGRLVSTLERAAIATSDAGLQCILHYRAASVRFAKLDQPNEALDSLLKAIHAVPDESIVSDELARVYGDSEMFASLLGVLNLRLEQLQNPTRRVVLTRKIGRLLDLLGRQEEAADFF